jgi:hypothetical protein
LSIISNFWYHVMASPLLWFFQVYQTLAIAEHFYWSRFAESQMKSARILAKTAANQPKMPFSASSYFMGAENGIFKWSSRLHPARRTGQTSELGAFHLCLTSTVILVLPRLVEKGEKRARFRKTQFAVKTPLQFT